MKVSVEFDSDVDREQVIHLAVHAKRVYCLIDDLLIQLPLWIEENPNDQ